MILYYKNLRKLFGAFSRLEGFTNWVIAKAELKIDGDSNLKLNNDIHNENINDDAKDRILKAEIKKQKKNYVLTYVADKSVELQIHLMKILNRDKFGFNSYVCNKEGKDKAYFEDYVKGCDIFFVGNMSFDKKDILDFVNDVNDNNPIHRTQSAVVPGFLILERLLKSGYLNDKEKLNTKIYDRKTEFCEIKYLLPVFEKEKIEIYKNNKNFEAWIRRFNDKNEEIAFKVFVVSYVVLQ